jgi:hypothetical protein
LNAYPPPPPPGETTCPGHHFLQAERKADQEVVSALLSNDSFLLGLYLRILDCKTWIVKNLQIWVSVFSSEYKKKYLEKY